MVGAASLAGTRRRHVTGMETTSDRSSQRVRGT
jgi:hypothetical protein